MVGPYLEPFPARNCPHVGTGPHLSEAAFVARLIKSLIFDGMTRRALGLGESCDSAFYGPNHRTGPLNAADVSSHLAEISQWNMSILTATYHLSKRAQVSLRLDGQTRNGEFGGFEDALHGHSYGFGTGL